MPSDSGTHTRKTMGLSDDIYLQWSQAASVGPLYRLIILTTYPMTFLAYDPGNMARVIMLGSDSLYYLRRPEEPGGTGRVSEGKEGNCQFRRRKGKDQRKAYGRKEKGWLWKW